MHALPARFSLLLAGAAITVFAGCGGSTSLPSMTAAAKSLGVSPPKDGTLLYVSSVIPRSERLYVYSYPQAKFIGIIRVPEQPFGLCTDAKGDVFVTTERFHHNSSEVYEYAHGGTQPIAKLEDPGQGWGCSVDPTTGNLAVTNWGTASSGDGNVAIYQNAQGKPRTYFDPNIAAYLWCAYDSQGNLFVDGSNGSRSHIYPFGELPAGASSFNDVTLDRKVTPGSLQWSDGNLIVADYQSITGPEKLYRVAFSGSKGTVVGVTKLASRKGMNSWGGQYVVYDKNVAGPSFPRRFVSVWSYPKGGKADRYVTHRRVGEFFGTAVSVAP